jgi:hypothetical protein
VATFATVFPVEAVADDDNGSKGIDPVAIAIKKNPINFIL